MTYLFVNNQEIKNDSGNPIPSAIIHAGNPVTTLNPLPVSLGSDAITITGNVNVGTSVEISNDIGNAVPISGTVSIDNYPTTQTIDGTVSIDNYPNVQTVAGTIGLDSITLSALETINANIAGTVSIDNYPSVQTVNGTIGLDSASLTALENINASVTGTVSIDNYPSVQTVDGVVGLDSTSLTALENITATVVFPDTQNVAVISIPEVEIKNDSNNPIAISKNTSQNSDINPIFVKGTSDTSFFAPTQSDAFGRLRVSNPYTIFDGTFRYSDDSRNWAELISGTASSTHSSITSSISMTVGTTSGDSIIRQTKRYFQYQPGKSQLVLSTFTMQPKTNVSQKVGYFDGNNGIYLENDGSTTYFVKLSNGTATKVAQSNWSENTFNALDITKAQIFWTDIEWLGVGSVRCGFVVNGEFIHCHTFHHANIATSTYMTTATLPIRYEIVNTGASVSSTTLEQICCAVISEGGYTPKVATRAISTALTGLSMSTTDYRPLVAIRLKTGRSGAVVKPTSSNFYGLQATPFNYQILSNATITGGTWVSASDQSNIEYNITATALSGGSNLLQGMFIGGTYVQPTTIDFTNYNGSYQLRSDLNNNYETFVLAARSTTNNDNALASLIWEELN